MTKLTSEEMHKRFLMGLEDTDECILWPFCVAKDGYGKMKINNISTNAHRASLLFNIGPPPSTVLHAYHAAHSCRNRSCVNPKHLSWKTPLENSVDKIRDGTQTYGEENSRSKLKNSDVQEISLRFIAGHSTNDIAKDYGVSAATISCIKMGFSWKNQTEGLRHKWTYTKKKPMSEEEAKTVISLIKKGLSNSQIRDRTGFKSRAIINIRHSKTFKHLPRKD